MAEILEQRTGDGFAGQGRDRPRHRDRAGADRRRRTRCRSVARADDPRFDRCQPQRRRHVGQPLDPAIRPRAAPCLRRGPPDLSSTGFGAARCRYRCARHRGRHHFGARQCQDQLLGIGRRRLARSRRHAGRNAEARDAARAGRPFGAADRHSRQGVCPAALHPRSVAAGHAAWPRAAPGPCAREAARTQGRRRPRDRRSRRRGPRRQFCRRRQRDRARRGEGASSVAQRRDVVRRRAAAR